jgi:hypothetical protein
MLRYGRGFRQVAAMVLLGCIAGLGRGQSDLATPAVKRPSYAAARQAISSSAGAATARRKMARGSGSGTSNGPATATTREAASSGNIPGNIYSFAGLLLKSNAATFPNENTNNGDYPSSAGGSGQGQGGFGNYFPTDDTGAATQAGVLPGSVAVDQSGNVYIADYGNNMIREVPVGGATPGINRLVGSVWTTAPVGTVPPYDGVTVNSCGDLFFAGSTTTCNLNNSVATAANLYDTNFNVQGAVTTFPQDVKVDANGNVYFVDSGDQVVEVLYEKGTVPGLSGPTPGNVYTLAGAVQTPTAFPLSNGPGSGGGTGEGGLASAATFGGTSYTNSVFGLDNVSNLPEGPEGIFLDPAGNIYVADTFNNLVRVIYQADPAPPALAALGITVNPATDKGKIYTIAGTYTLGSVSGANACGFSDPEVVATECGEGLLATSAFLNNPIGISVDASGNVYVADTVDNLVRALYVGAGSLPGIANPQAGHLYTIAGDVADVAMPPITPPLTSPYDTPYPANACATTRANNCGDGGAALAASLYLPSGIAQDSSGNLFIADSGDQVVRVLYQAGQLAGLSGSLAANNLYTYAGTIAGAGADASNVVLLTPNGCDVTAVNFITCGDGGAALSAQLYFPAGLAIDSQNNLYIADFYDGEVREVAGMPPAQSQTITFPSSGTLPASVVYGNAPIALNATASSGLPVTFTVTGAGHLDTSTSTPTAVVDSVGTIAITASQAGGSGFLPATPVTVNIQVTPAVLTVTGSTISIPFGSPVPDFSGDYTITGFQYSDNSSSLTGAPTITPKPPYTSATPVGTILALDVTQGTLAANPPNYTFALVNGSVTVTGGVQQTITFPAIPNQTYGVAPLMLNATASSGLPVTYTVSPGAPVKLAGSTLTISGVAASVTVTASQAGNNTYAPAASVSRTFAIAPAALTLTANNISVIQNGTIPPLTYTISGFVNGDTQATATSGSPTLVAGATSNEPVGTYPITISAGSFVAPNYAPNFVNGTLTIVEPTPQSINFPALPAQVSYGVGNIPVSATATSGLPVTFTVSGPGLLVGGPSVQVIGAGTITITASQAGNSVYGPAAPVTQTITVAQAVLTVTADTYTIALGTAGPTTPGYTFTGFVNGDQTNVVSGTALTSTTYAGVSTPPGVYPVTVMQNPQDPLTATNYTFTFVDGTITVLLGPPPDFSITSSPTAVTLAPGQVQSVTVLATPINGYDNPYSSSAGTGGITFSCTNLPANVTCTFTPATVSVNGSSTLVGPSPTGTTTTLTIGASNSAVAAMRSPAEGRGSAGVLPAAIFLLPGGLAGAFLGFSRKRFARNTRMRQWLVLICLLAGVMGMGACGYSNTLNTSGFAKPGTSTIEVQAVGAPANSATGATGTITHAIEVTLTVQ